MRPALALLVVSTFCVPALAHPGHRWLGAHWHASDSMAVVAVVAAIATGLWWFSGKR